MLNCCHHLPSNIKYSSSFYSFLLRGFRWVAVLFINFCTREAFVCHNGFNYIVRKHFIVMRPVQKRNIARTVLVHFRTACSGTNKFQEANCYLIFIQSSYCNFSQKIGYICKGVLGYTTGDKTFVLSCVVTKWLQFRLSERLWLKQQICSWLYCDSSIVNIIVIASLDAHMVGDLERLESWTSTWFIFLELMYSKILSNPSYDLCGELIVTVGLWGIQLSKGFSCSVVFPWRPRLTQDPSTSSFHISRTGHVSWSHCTKTGSCSQLMALSGY